MAEDFLNERLLCSGCRTSLVIEYAPDQGGTSCNVMITCPACQATFEIVLPRPASLFIVRRSGDTPVLRRRVRPQ